MEPLKQKLRSTSGGKILDVATGTGGFIMDLVDAFHSYRHAVGIDSSPQIVNFAKTKANGDNIQFKVMNAEKLAFKNDAFDTVAVRHSLHHFHRAQLVLAEMKRVLKVGGLFIICEAIQDKKAKGPNPHIAIHHWFAEIDRANGITHNEMLTWREIVALAQTLDLRGLELFEHSQPKSNSNHKHILDSFAHKCDVYVDRIKDNPKLKHLVNRGVQLKSALYNSDFSWGPDVYVLGWK